MDKAKCPGQDLRYWAPEDIYEVPCVSCKKPIEFFKDDLRRRCPHCGKINLNPTNDLSCAAWCSAAVECLKELGRDLPPSGVLREPLDSAESKKQ
jgi:predicted RNA-binding Zn-ribbon protein involved in translation (DUF1610 family)